MAKRDSVLCGDGTIGNYVVGFFECGGDGDDAELAVLQAYRDLGYDPRPERRRGCLEAVVHDGRLPGFERFADQHCVRAEQHAAASAGGLGADEVSELIRRHRTEV